MLISADYFIDPVTKEHLIQRKGYLENKAGKKYRYSRKYKYWNFMPDFQTGIRQDLWKTWEHLQKNGACSYRNDPKRNLGVGKRDDHIRFGNFCSLKGVVLDIGVGPQKAPSHLKYATKKDISFIGLDPLRGELPKSFGFVQGLGEYLPFKDELFDFVIYVTSLDHFIDPYLTLCEAKRVLKITGKLCIMTGIKDKNAPKPLKSPSWYRRIKIPQGAEDPFHFRKLTCERIEGMLADLDFKLVSKKVTNLDTWRKNIYYKARLAE